MLERRAASRRRLGLALLTLTAATPGAVLAVGLGATERPARERLEARLGEVEARLRAVDGRLRAVDGRLRAVDGRLYDLEVRAVNVGRVLLARAVEAQRQR